VEWIFTLQLAGSGHRENPLGELLSGFRLVAKAQFSPLNGWA
jgi:hypothetical protein